MQAPLCTQSHPRTNMTTSTRECHVMDIRSEQNSWEEIIGEEMKRFDPKKEEEQRNKKSIYRIPSFVKLMKSPTVSTPQVVSFGPYHHGEENLKFVEGYKQKALLHFLHRNKKSLGHFVNAIKDFVEELQACYEFLEDKWEDEAEFIKLMITDGCFMLEVLRFDSKSPQTQHTCNDPIFSVQAFQHKLPYIKRDMLMLENQLPLLVIKVLIDAEKADQCCSPVSDQEINNLVFKFVGMEDMKDKDLKLGFHILDLYRTGMTTATNKSQQFQETEGRSWILNLCGKSSDNIPKPYSQRGDAKLPTARKLHESGVKFRTFDIGKIKDISFKSGTLKLPPLTIDDSTESTLLNLMAFEHLHVGVEKEVTSYVCFLDELSDSADDVHLLCSNKIINNAVGSDQAAADLLNSLTKEVIHDPTSTLADIRKTVKAYSDHKLNRWRANLMQIYFDTPWKTLGVIIAVVVLVFTFVQTFYTVFGYHRPLPN
ncbi:hypothetical protein IHE45_14G090300 [Dioscorea alata]|uniref:Uncharacterized protein n=1 Tax=Dioscorea alata TaxID=55571 RepID=A0ACB7UTM7_DIOAL|nr:hypothetical protein IHE45_14G090300 [Dioscorea alata]